MLGALSHSAKIKSPIKAVVNFISDAAHAIVYSDNSCLAIKTTFEVATSDPDVQKVLREDHDFTHKFLSDLIKKAIALKELDAQTDSDTVTDFIINTFTGWHESYILHKDPIKIQRMAKYLTKYIMIAR